MFKVNRDYYEFFTSDLNLPTPVYTRGKKWVVVFGFRLNGFIYIIPFVKADKNSFTNDEKVVWLNINDAAKYWYPTRFKVADSLLTKGNACLLEYIFPAKDNVIIMSKRTFPSEVRDKPRKVILDIKLHDFILAYEQIYFFSRYMGREGITSKLINIAMHSYCTNEKHCRELEVKAKNFIKEHEVKASSLFE